MAQPLDSTSAAGEKVCARRRTIDRLLRDNPGATVGDVPAILAALKKSHADRPSGYNHTRSHLLACATPWANGHPRYQDTRAVKALSAPRKRQPLIVKPVEARRLVAECRYGADIWSLFVTGMRWKEYTVDGWEVVADRPRHVAIRGQKHAGRVRAVPLVDTPTTTDLHRENSYQSLTGSPPRHDSIRLPEHLPGVA